MNKARIEISLSEYNAMKSRIEDLEKELAKKDKENNEARTVIEDLQNCLNYIIDGTTWAERTFEWKKIIKAVRER